MGVPGSLAEASTKQTAVVATGSCGRWDFAIDETTSGLRQLSAQLEGPTIYLDFAISTLDIVKEAIDFLRGKIAPSTICLGGDEHSKVSLIRDDEIGGRFFIAVENGDVSLVRFVISKEDAENIAGALEQAAEDL